MRVKEFPFDEWMNEWQQRLPVQDSVRLGAMLTYYRESYYFSGFNETVLEQIDDLMVLSRIAAASGEDFFIRYTQFLLEQYNVVPYTEGYYRRAFRTKSIAPYKEKIIKNWFYYFLFFQLGQTMPHYFNGKYEQDDEVDCVTEMHIAYLLNSGDEATEKALHAIIFGDNQGKLLNDTIIKGILSSERVEWYEHLAQLLLAAQLQEGLRQSIVERIDESHVQAFRHFLPILIEHNLVRFSSVVRAIGTWTGLNVDALKPRQTKQLLEFMQRYMNDEPFKQGSAIQHAHELYIGLWSIAFEEIERAEAAICEVIANGAKHQRVTALAFLATLQQNDYQAQIALQFLAESDNEVRYWLTRNLPKIVYYYYADRHGIETDEAKQQQLKEAFAPLVAWLQEIPQQGLTFQSVLYDDATIHYERSDVSAILLYINQATGYIFTEQLIALSDWLTSDQRNYVLQYQLGESLSAVERAYVLQCLHDRSSTVRQTALSRLKSLPLTEAEQYEVEQLLTLKSANIREAAIHILLQSDELAPVLERLLTNKKSEARQAGLTMLLQLKETEHEQFAELTKLTAKIVKPTKNEQVLLDQLSVAEMPSLANLFGQFNEPAPLPLPSYPVTDDVFFTTQAETMIALYEQLNQLVTDYKDTQYEIEYYDGSKEIATIGTRFWSLKNGDLPLQDVWDRFMAEQMLPNHAYIELDFMRGTTKLYDYAHRRFSRWERDYYEQQFAETGEEMDVTDEQQSFITDIYPLAKWDYCQTKLEQLPYMSEVIAIVNHYIDRKRSSLTQAYFQFATNVYHAIPTIWKEKSFFMSHVFDPALNRIIWTEELFNEAFYLHYDYYARAPKYRQHIELDDLMGALQRDLIDENWLAVYTLRSGDHHQILRHLTEGTVTDEKLSSLRDWLVRTLVDCELQRGDLPTDATDYISAIARIEGIEYFTKIVTRLDKEPFVRGYIYTWNSSLSKREAFSQLMRHVYPKKDETSEQFIAAVRPLGLTEKRLIEVAMYVPQWTEMIADYLQWPGFRQAIWYFHAHMNDHFSEEKQAIIAHYSPITAEQFRGGAFDLQWFNEAHETIGEERFAMLYDSAKYIAGGGAHRRAQLFADATLGKLNLNETKAKAHEKRNKDQLLSYSLIPLGDEADLYDRYQFVQQFRLESKQFGAQRRASEGLSCDIALSNLARNAGYDDETRLQWAMEVANIAALQSYMEPTVVGDYTLQIVFDETGYATLVIASGDKPLKSVPAKLKKDETYLAWKAEQTALRQQWKRAKAQFELAMVRRTQLTGKEVAKLVHHPVLHSFIDKLVWKSDEAIGFYRDVTFKDDERVIVAHPIDLYESGRWSEWQKQLFHDGVKQPFKQVFRELYVPSEDELAGAVHSKRYAGHQVQPQKAAALLKSCGWTAQYGEGLQKVDYKANIIAEVYALADWFTPSEVEAPTLEQVSFYDRLSHEAIPIAAVPPHIFSEVMRDLDLVVSVAHVGGVDVEASLSTMELRQVIVDETVQLMKLTNVRTEGKFVYITGALGEYNIHLGSGTVFKQAHGALSVLPVHSQHRGAIFLPFVDEDPKTAEIIAKVVTFANDGKIKDPSILAQLV